MKVLLMIMNPPSRVLTQGTVAVLAAVLVAVFGAAGLVAQSAVGSRPNIVFILADDLGYSDLGCFGGEIRTPVLDALAANGVRLTQLYNTGRCCPSRAALPRSSSV